MLNTEFTINLTEPIKPGKVTVGYFDGIHPSIVAVTRTDKIFVHNPHNRSVIDPNTGSSAAIDPQNVRQSMGQFTTASSGNDLNFLNINQTITCLAAGSLSSSSVSNQTENEEPNSLPKAKGERRTSIRRKSLANNDVLVVGTKTSVHVYDILHNTDLYYKEIPDGANTVIIGRFGSADSAALVGGNCAIHGFDRDGNDTYWMVTGDNITAMALVDIDGDKQKELIVGSEDCELQIFKKDAIVKELSETDKIVSLCSLDHHLFAYALANGTVGVYRTNGDRLWRIKSKNQPICLAGVDVNNDGQLELLTGWSNGKLDVRVAHTGEVLVRENLKSSIAGIMVADYNMDGRPELMVCTVSGEVVGYRLDVQEERHQLVDTNFEQETIRELMKKKQTILQALRNYEENFRVQNLTDPLVMNKGKVLNEKGDHYGAIPVNTKLRSSLLLKQSPETLMGYIELKLETTNSTEIRAVIVFAEGIFQYESTVVYPPDDEVSSSITVSLCPPKDLYIDMHIKVLVGYRVSTHYHVFELSRHLPRFSMFAIIGSEATNARSNNGYSNNLESIDFKSSHHENTDGGENIFKAKVVQPKSYVIVRMPASIVRVLDWINNNFLLDSELELNDQERRIVFVSMRTRASLILEMSRNSKNEEQPEVKSDKDELIEDVEEEYKEFVVSYEKPVSTGSITVKILCDSIEVAGNVIQSMGDHLEVVDLPCARAYFPNETEQLKQLVDRVEEIQSVRQHLVAEVADSANLIRSAVVQAEDARITQEYQRMRQIYNDLSMLNREILREHKIRCQNHVDLVDCLKQINLLIQRASNLRIGKFKTHFITTCREAIKQKNFKQLFKIISED